MEKVPLPLREIVRRYVSRESAWHKQDDPRVYHVSSVWRCFRQAWILRRWVATGQAQSDKDTSDFLLGLFAMGKKVEQTFEEALKAHHDPRFIRNDFVVAVYIDYVAKEAKPVRHDATFEELLEELPPNCILVVGESDIVVLGYNGRIVKVIECKSNAAGEKATPNAAQEHQAAFYPKLMGAKAEVALAARNSILAMPEDSFPVQDVDRKWEESINYFAELHTQLQLDQLPAAQPLLGWECEKCPVLSTCQKAGGWVNKPRELKRGPRKGLVIDSWKRTLPALYPGEDEFFDAPDEKKEGEDATSA